MKTLLHLCCANCAIYPVKTLKERGIETVGFWYNPNIQPATEYVARLEAVKQLQQAWSLDMIYDSLYGLTEFLRAIVGREKERCLHCYAMRLEETARRAKAEGYDAFSTTLLYSIYQNYGAIVEQGRVMEEKYDIEFHVEDYRTGWKEGIALSKELSLYRQKYCGCIYSELERYSKLLKKTGCTY